MDCSHDGELNLVGFLNGFFESHLLTTKSHAIYAKKMLLAPRP